MGFLRGIDKERKLQSAGGFSGDGGGNSMDVEVVSELIYVIVEITYHTLLFPEFWYILGTLILLIMAFLIVNQCVDVTMSRFVNPCISLFYRYTTPSKRKWLARADGGKKIKVVNSTRWRGNYTQDGGSFFIPEFTMSVDKQLNITGNGKDNIGNYNLVGRQVCDRAALTKTYIPDHNAHHNRGHKVRILLTVTDQDRMEGRWMINSEKYSEGQMTFCSI
jgi:hypothetical protein